MESHERTSTIWPLKISSAFWIRGSFLNSSASIFAEPDFSDLARGAALPGAADAGSADGAGGRGGDSAWANLICTFGWPSSWSLVCRRAWEGWYNLWACGGGAAALLAQLLQLLQDRVNIEGVAGLHGFEQGHFEKNLFGRGIAQTAFRLAQDLHHAGERIGAGQRGLFLEVRGLGLGDFEQFQITARQLVDEQIPKMIQQVRQQPAQVLAVFGQVVQFA